MSCFKEKKFLTVITLTDAFLFSFILSVNKKIYEHSEMQKKLPFQDPNRDHGGGKGNNLVTGTWCI